MFNVKTEYTFNVESECTFNVESGCTLRRRSRAWWKSRRMPRVSGKDSLLKRVKLKMAVCNSHRVRHFKTLPNWKLQISR